MLFLFLPGILPCHRRHHLPRRGRGLGQPGLYAGGCARAGPEDRLGDELQSPQAQRLLV